MALPIYIKELSKLSGLEQTDFLESIIERKEMKKGEFLFKGGDICRHVFFIEKGIVRLFYHSNSGKDITAWFFTENSFLTAIDSFYYHKATRDYCELLEDSVIFFTILHRIAIVKREPVWLCRVKELRYRFAAECVSDLPAYGYHFR